MKKIDQPRWMREQYSPKVFRKKETKLSLAQFAHRELELCEKLDAGKLPLEMAFIRQDPVGRWKEAYELKLFELTQRLTPPMDEHFQALQVWYKWICYGGIGNEHRLKNSFFFQMLYQWDKQVGLEALQEQPLPVHRWIEWSFFNSKKTWTIRDDLEKYKPGFWEEYQAYKLNQALPERSRKNTFRL